jgi:hypothetical protein
VSSNGTPAGSRMYERQAGLDNLKQVAISASVGRDAAHASHQHAGTVILAMQRPGGMQSVRAPTQQPVAWMGANPCHADSPAAVNASSAAPSQTCVSAANSSLWTEGTPWCRRTQVSCSSKVVACADSWQHQRVPLMLFTQQQGRSYCFTILYQCHSKQLGAAADDVDDQQHVACVARLILQRTVKPTRRHA